MRRITTAIILASSLAIFACDPLGPVIPTPDAPVKIVSDTLFQYTEDGPSFKAVCTSRVKEMKLTYTVDGVYRDTILFNPAETLEVFPAEAYKEMKDDILYEHAILMDTLKVDGKVINPVTRDTVLFKAYTRIAPKVDVKVAWSEYSGGIRVSTDVTVFPKSPYNTVEAVYVNEQDGTQVKAQIYPTESGFKTIGTPLASSGIYNFVITLDDLNFRFERHCINYMDIVVKCGIERFEGKVRPVIKCTFRDSRPEDERMGLSLTIQAKGACSWMEDFRQSVEECESYQHNFVYEDILDYSRTVHQGNIISSVEYPLDIDFQESILKHHIDVRAAKNPDGTVCKQKDPVLGYYIIFDTFDKYYDMESVSLSVALDAGIPEYVRISQFDIDEIKAYLGELYASERSINNTYAEIISDISRKLTAIIQQAE